MKQEYAGQYAELERGHWWFQGRRCILRRLLRREVDWRGPRKVLEVGVGPGVNLYSLYPPEAVLMGVEPDPENARLADGLGKVPVHEGTVEKLPAAAATTAFDVITMFDVLEHIENDGAALEILKARLEPGGRLLLTVPAYQWMWGAHDDVNHHFRRYTRGRLKRLLQDAGFIVSRASYFNTWLFPPIAAVRLLAKLAPRRKSAGGAVGSDFDKPTGILNAPLRWLFASEALFLTWMSFPFGVSLFVSARKGDS